jgi:carbon monoxide dehydrogenase subunit G
MAIRIEKQFTVDAAPQAVWAFLTDPERVARCLPGASITEQIDDHTWGGRMALKVGPVSTAYKGRITFERLDAATHTAELRATGQDVQGRGGADMTMTSKVEPEGSGTTVTVTSDVNVTGILAQFGRGMIQDVSNQLFGTFVTRAREQLAAGGGGGGGAATGGGTMGGGGTSAGGAAPGSAAGGAQQMSATRATGATGATGATARSSARPLSEPATDDVALDVLALGRSAMASMLARQLRRPLFWVLIVVIVLIVFGLIAR